MLAGLAGLTTASGAMEWDGATNSRQPSVALAAFEAQVANLWGHDNVWIPSSNVWVQYEPDLGERSAVDFENGVARIQVLLKAGDDPGREIVLAHLCQGVGNLILGQASDPVEMVNQAPSEAPENRPAATLPPGKEVRVYLVRRGDTLGSIAQRFRMPIEALARLNELDSAEILPAGRPLKVIVLAAHDLTLDPTPRPMAKDPLLLDQIRMVDGRPVPPWMVREFAAEVVRQQPPGTEKVTGADGIERQAVTVAFKLAQNHLEVRARKFQPLVLAYAERFNLDPALIMAIIHTESFFNPRARSHTPAYGLMQLVPHTAGREAYREIYGKKRALTPQFLYDPENNIELGTAYFSILENRYMAAITDPTSRTYCAVAAYNAGASNVGKAFIRKKSIRQATPVINGLKPKEVYDRLVGALPGRESRNYVRKVLKRASKYRDWK
jgi:membrane-bound lytic murein transglycosylase C